MARAAFRRRVLSLTPLVDVIFLLLLFFMLSSTFSRYAEIELVTAMGGTGAQLTHAQFLQLGEARLRLAGREVTLEALADLLADKQVMVSLDAGVTAQRLIDVMGGLRRVPNLSVTVLQ